MQGALDPPAAALLHAAPVLERHLDELVGWDRGNRLVPVLYLHGVQGDVDDIAVGTEVGRFDPVANADHAVRGDGETGNEGENGVAEHEDDDGHQRTDSRQQHPGGLAGQHRRRDQGADDVDDDLGYLRVALHRHLGARVVAGDDLLGSVDRRAHHEQHDHG